MASWRHACRPLYVFPEAWTVADSLTRLAAEVKTAHDAAYVQMALGALALAEFSTVALAQEQHEADKITLPRLANSAR